MPYSRCTICGGFEHLNVSLPVEGWYRGMHPDVPVGELVPGICFFCWVEIREGERIKVRDLIGKNAWIGNKEIRRGMSGVVEKAYRGREGGMLYRVKLDNEQVVHLIRGEIEKYRPEKVRPKPSEKETAPCPHCDKPLKTSKARQCFGCGMDWHDPENVRKQGEETEK